ncbi:Membrane-associated guanylate kinase, WW and PDZ domain-containing protein 1 [Echinococcus granulosus]|nr:Membrane-associated guanylate kinase, WW and PDZ domain-containing protein 1 [Echinococcus granulosus]
MHSKAHSQGINYKDILFTWLLASQHVGDRLLSINGVNEASLQREEFTRLVKASGSQFARTVLPCNTSLTPSSEQMQFYNSQLHHHQQQQLHQQEKARAVFFQVTLFYSSRGFGLTIRGGHEFNQMPFTIFQVAEGGPAHLDGRLKAVLQRTEEC